MTTVHSDRRQARIDRETLDQILVDLGVEQPWTLSTHEAISTLQVVACNLDLKKRSEKP